MNKSSLLRFTFEGASPCSATPLITSADGHIAIVFKDCVYLIKWDGEIPRLVTKIKSQQLFSEPINTRLRFNSTNDDNLMHKMIYEAMDRSKHSIIYASFTPLTPITNHTKVTIDNCTTSLKNFLGISYLVTCMDSGIVYYWLPSYDYLNYVLKMPMNEIFAKNNITLYPRYYLELSGNSTNGFLQAVASNENVLFFWLICVKRTNVNSNNNNSKIRSAQSSKAVKSAENGRYRRLAAAKAMQLYSSLTITEEDDSDDYVNSVESSDPEATQTSGGEDILMLLAPNSKYIGAYSGYNMNNDKGNVSDILSKFDYRKPLSCELKSPDYLLEYRQLYLHCMPDGEDITAIKVGDIFFDKNSGVKGLASCTVLVANVVGSVHTLCFSFNETYQSCTTMYVYNQDLMLVSPSTLFFKELSTFSANKATITAFCSSNQVFIGYKNLLNSLQMDFQVAFVKPHSIAAAEHIFGKLVIIGINDQLKQFEFTISSSSITFVEISVVCPINVTIEANFLAKTNPNKLIGVAAIPASYYISELYYNANLFELALCLPKDFKVLSCELMQVVASHYLNSNRSLLLFSKRLVEKFHPLSLEINPNPNLNPSGGSNCTATRAAAGDSCLAELFSYLTEQITGSNTGSECLYYKNLVLDALGDPEGGLNRQLNMILLLSNLAYSFLSDTNTRDNFLSKVDFYRRKELIQLIQSEIMSGVDVDGIVGGNFPVKIIVENLKLIDEGVLLSLKCFCGEDSVCRPPFAFYLCDKSHKIPACSITRCGLLGSDLGAVVPTQVANGDSWGVKYEALDHCSTCGRFAISLYHRCFICGGALTKKTLLRAS